MYTMTIHSGGTKSIVTDVTLDESIKVSKMLRTGRVPRKWWPVKIKCFTVTSANLPGYSSIFMIDNITLVEFQDTGEKE